jgi:E-phenylitaconyl-CoA hydratase
MCLMGHLVWLDQWRMADASRYAAIRSCFQRFDSDAGLDVAIFTGVGPRAFCAGSDIKSNFAGGGIDAMTSSGASTTGADKDDDEAASWNIGKVQKIVIVAINGHCNGGGLEQALACDIRVAVGGAQFGMGEVRLGLLPGAGGTQRLPRLIPRGRAMQVRSSLRVRQPAIHRGLA